MATRVQLVYVNRGTSEFPGVKYETEVIEEGQYSRVSDGFFKTVIIIPIDEDIYFDIGPNPDPSNVGKQFIVARGSEREIKFSRDTRIAIKLLEQKSITSAEATQSRVLILNQSDGLILSKSLSSWVSVLHLKRHVTLLMLLREP
jgi:hypothetical protein